METTKCVRGPRGGATKLRKPLITDPLGPTTEREDQVANLAAVLANPEGKNLSLRIVETEKALATKRKESERWANKAEVLAQEKQSLIQRLADKELQISSAQMETTEAKGLSSAHFARAERLDKELAEVQSALKLASAATELYRRELGSAETNCQSAVEASKLREEHCGVLESQILGLREQITEAQSINSVAALALDLSTMAKNIEAWIVGSVAALVIGAIAFCVGRWAR